MHMMHTGQALTIAGLGSAPVTQASRMLAGHAQHMLAGKIGSRAARGQARAVGARLGFFSAGHAVAAGSLPALWQASPTRIAARGAHACLRKRLRRALDPDPWL